MDSWTQKLDNFWKGLIIGIFFPWLMFFFYWMFFHGQLNFPRGFMRYLLAGNLLSNVIKVCGIGNLILFYFGLTKKIDNFTKGIIASVLLYVGLVAYVTYYLEPEIL
jgi:hypothetical protein